MYRAKTPPKGIADQISSVPEGVFEEDFTGRYDGEELAKMRATRDPEDRLARLEKNQDDLRSSVEGRLQKVEVGLADFGGQMKIIPDLVDAMKDATKALRERDHVVFTSKVELDTAKKVADVHVGEAEKVDEIAKKKSRRELWAKIVGAVIAGGAIGKILHMAGLL